MALSAYEAQALSSTTLGSQDITVGTATIEVEPGEGPLWLAISSYQPIIWRFTGAVGRIERAVVASNASGGDQGASIAGVVGLDAAKVTFLPRCLPYFQEVPSSEASRALATVRGQIGRDGTAAATYAVSEFVVPAGTARVKPHGDRGIVPISQARESAAKAPPGRDWSLYSQLHWYYPGGVVAVDPASVHATLKPLAYEVLPEIAGLSQLADRGAIVRNKSGEYVIKEKIRLPAGLSGALSARFLLLRGVPEPDGDPGHSCVISEETGMPVKGSGRSTCK